jgi:thioredoxin-related protein
VQQSLITSSREIFYSISANAFHFLCFMKYWIVFCLSLSSLISFSQQADISIPPYKRFPTLPPLQLLLGDSSTKYTKANIPAKKAVLVMIFSPDCSHCQHTAEEMVENKENLKNVHIIMSTISSISEMNKFMEKYGLDKMPNVVAGKDIYFLLPPFYGLKNFPYMAFYNKKGDLILGFEGSMSIPKVIQTFETAGKRKN